MLPCQLGVFVLCWLLAAILQVHAVEWPDPLSFESPGCSLVQHAAAKNYKQSYANPHRQTRKELLVFWSVGSERRVQTLVKKNVAHLHMTLGRRNVNVYLAHYDLQQAAWGDGTPWYAENVKFSAQQKGQKWQLAQSLLKGVNLARYSWIWILDDDVDFSDTNVTRMLQLAEEAKIEIGIPAFTQDGVNSSDTKHSYPFQLPQADCLYRYSGMVEVIFPFFRPVALETVLFDCEHCIHNQSVWGLDYIWCSRVAHKVGKDRYKTCAVIDAAPVVHRNFHVLGSQSQMREVASEAMLDVHAHHKEDWIDPLEASFSTECVDLSGNSHMRVENNTADSGRLW
eukprot:CAMPEP_0197633336 /NCGR_PEP_ID=MMETSP1338-20131121/9721_1 /TAXON_ID=43686 ORGANISM="Pelagodinium beii, Strain RCC1491" /NCGR_SAMPLE_ID=MMETSP1338 /ASSEMBLY_ACC=CAM_ASM_000754 /LENGTH=339 /DNA_ID=CAMNT_0043204979 /DNA_START=39 /DNA_END=1058 /DNA_ORIENTATION=+